MKPPKPINKTLPLYVVDAFTEGPFTGNPAAVCPLDAWLPDDLLQKIAVQNNLSETAFFVPEGAAFRLRWFAPGGEVDLCGHATLASAFVLAEVLAHGSFPVQFLTRSGPLSVARVEEESVLDAPALPLTPEAPPEDLLKGLGLSPRETFRSMDWVAVLPDAAAVRDLRPDLDHFKRLDARGVIVTAPGEGGVDYVLRMFGPKAGIPEDPVTGSAQSMLAPYWAGRLGKKKLTGRQLSARGGCFTCEVSGDRVQIAGKSRLYLKGDIFL